MSFWRTFGFHTVSVIETILDREGFTLEEILDEEELLQELKSQNKKLLDFLAQPATMRKLFEYVTQQFASPTGTEGTPTLEDGALDANNNNSNSLEQKRKFKYPFLACEILCTDIWMLTEAIFRDEALLDLLFTFLDRPAPLDPLVASYVTRVASILLGRRTSEMLTFLRARENVVSKFLHHLGTATVMDLLLKIVSAEESPEGVGTLEWLCRSDLIPCLVQKLGPDNEPNVHENAGQTLVDIIAISSNVMSSPLLVQLESQEQIAHIFTHITSSNGSSLLHGLTVIIELLKRHYKEPTSSTDSPDEPLPPLLQVSLEHFESLHALLKSPPPTEYTAAGANTLTTTTGPLTPLGFYRLKIIEFFLAVLRTRFDALENAILKLGVINTTLDLFFQYPWNNFLHIATEQIIQTILGGQNVPAKVDLLLHAHLLDRIVEANRINIAEASSKSGRRGYMGFLTTMATSIGMIAQSTEELDRVVQAHQGWAEYVSGSLQEIRNIEMKPLGGHRPTVFPGDHSSGDEEEEQQHDSDSIYDRYKLGFSDDNDDGFDEYDENEMGFDNNADFSHHSRPFEWKDDDDEDKQGSDSDDDVEELWVRRGDYDQGEGEDQEQEQEHDQEEGHDEEGHNGVAEDTDASTASFQRPDADAAVNASS